MLTPGDTGLYTVWVGGVEVNDYHIPIDVATEIALHYELLDYDDVFIVPVEG